MAGVSQVHLARPKFAQHVGLLELPDHDCLDSRRSRHRPNVLPDRIKIRDGAAGFLIKALLK
jgi:hypothetical protein